MHLLLVLVEIFFIDIDDLVFDLFLSFVKFRDFDRFWKVYIFLYMEKL